MILTKKKIKKKIPSPVDGLPVTIAPVKTPKTLYARHAGWQITSAETSSVAICIRHRLHGPSPWRKRSPPPCSGDCRRAGRVLRGEDIVMPRRTYYAPCRYRARVCVFDCHTLVVPTGFIRYTNIYDDNACERVRDGGVSSRLPDRFPYSLSVSLSLLVGRVLLARSIAPATELQIFPYRQSVL